MEEEEEGGGGGGGGGGTKQRDGRERDKLEKRLTEVRELACFVLVEQQYPGM